MVVSFGSIKKGHTLIGKGWPLGYYFRAKY